MNVPRILLALDMDGTLLRDDKTISPVDAAAVRGAAAHGILVTLATGRLTTGTLPTARELGLCTPLVCADGGLLIDPESGASIHRRAIPNQRAIKAVQVLSAHGLHPYVFLSDAIHCEPAGERHRDILDTWSRELVVHDSLAEADLWQPPDSVSLTVGIGARGAVERAADELRRDHADALDTVHFGMGASTSSSPSASPSPSWAVRSLPQGCDKGEMLSRLAARMGITRDRVAVVGDWLNDLGMFKYAGRSFAMGQAPEVVRRAATDLLRCTSAAGGGVAEAITALRSRLDE